jgi:hypothetical protein
MNNEQRFTMRLPGTLLAELEAEAAADQRPVASLIRQILIDHVAQRIANNVTSKAG